MTKKSKVVPSSSAFASAGGAPVMMPEQILVGPNKYKTTTHGKKMKMKRDKGNVKGSLSKFLKA